MSLNQNIFRFTLFTLLLCCVFSTVAEAQRRRTRTAQCTPGTWVYRVANLGQTATTVTFAQAGVIVQVTDGDGNIDSRGGYFKVTNNGDETMEFQPDNTDSVWYPIEPGQSDMEGIPQYRGVKDKSPTKYSVKIRYKCGAQATQQPQQNNQANNQAQSNAQTNTQAQNQQPQLIAQKNWWVNQPFPVGCWKFTDSDDPKRTSMKVFKPNGELDIHYLTNDVGKDVSSISKTILKWRTAGEGIKMIGQNYKNEDEERGTFRLSGSQLSFFVQNDDNEYSTKWLRDVGVKDDTCGGIKP